MNKVKKFFKDNKLVVSCILLLNFILMVIFYRTKLNAIDLFYLIPQGKYILNNGIYHIDPFSIHSGLHVVVQNYMSSCLFYLIFKVFSWNGFVIYTIICNALICYLIYKICLLISSNNKSLSIIIMVINDILLYYFLVPRPQLLSYINLLLVIYLLELYVHKNNKKYLYFIPLISILQINIHASLWIMIFLFMLPYIVEGIFKKYNIKPILFIFLISLVCGLINPYGLENITFIFGSFHNKYMTSLIPELYKTGFNTLWGTIFLIILIINSLIYIIFVNKKVKIRYLCLYLGTMILGLSSLKGFSNYLLCSIFPFAYYFRNKKFNIDYSIISKLCNIFIVVLIIVSSLLIVLKRNEVQEYVASNSYSFLLKHYDKDDISLYSIMEDGGYGMFLGVKSYLDCRAEYFIKYNNKKYDILKEYFLLQHSKININEFLDKYKFTHLLLNSGDIMFKLSEIDGYKLIYIDKEYEYKLFVREDLIKSDTPEIKELYIRI
ncbi:MAG: hypothetical protein SO484_02555 [Bacilli bacterium]|nr:hypothetical protein [Bacilli bacterium]